MSGQARSSPADPHLERLQKVLAQAGVASRRECESIMQEGRVCVDGRIVTELGTKVDPARARIEVDGRRIRLERKVYYLFNKPKGVLSTNDASTTRRRIVDYFAELPERVFPVGRLDEETEGLILVTNDGELANRLTHPRYEVPKTYRVMVPERVAPEAVDKLRAGVYLSEGKTAPAQVSLVHASSTESVLEITLREGRNREVRRMLAAVGHEAGKLRRIAVGGLRDPKLGPGQWRSLSAREVELLRAASAGPAVPGGSRPGRIRSRRTGDTTTRRTLR